MSLKEARKCGGIAMDEQLDIEFKRKAYDKILEWFLVVFFHCFLLNITFVLKLLVSI